MCRSLAGCMVLIGSFAVGGCEERAPAPSLVLACDPTGPSPEDVCNRGLLSRVAERWAAEAVSTPGASLRTLLVGKDYSNTQVGPSRSVPAAFEEDPMLALPAWQANVVREFAAIPVEHDRPETRRVVRSDLVSLVTLSGMQAKPEPGAVVLLLATDGRLVSVGVDAEKSIPTSATVLARIAKSGVAPDLSVFSSVTICGIHHIGLGAGEHAALQNLWRELIVAWGGPSPTLLPSCTGIETALFDVVRPLPAAPALESGTAPESGR